MDIMLREGSDSIASMSGEADADNCHRIGEVLLDRHYDSATLRLDLSELTFMDSSAISELLRVQSVLGEEGVTVVISEVSPAVRRVLEITGLLDTFGVSSAT